VLLQGGSLTYRLLEGVRSWHALVSCYGSVNKGSQPHVVGHLKPVARLANLASIPQAERKGDVLAPCSLRWLQTEGSIRVVYQVGAAAMQAQPHALMEKNEPYTVQDP